MRYSLKKIPTTRVLFVLVFVVVGLVLLIRSLAATPIATFEAENAPTKQDVQQISNSGASAGAYLQFGDEAPIPDPDPDPTGRPSAANTGPSTTPTTTRAGGTISSSISNVSFTSAITVSCSNCTISNFKVRAYGALYSVKVTGTNVTLENGEIEGGQSAGLMGSNFTARRIHIREIKGDGVKPFGNVTVERSFIHRVGLKDLAQNIKYGDCFQMVGSSGLTAKGNYCQDEDTTGYVNAGFQLQDGASNIVIDGNWISGAGGSSRGVECKPNSGKGGVSNVTVRNNYFRGITPVTGTCTGINNMTF